MPYNGKKVVDIARQRGIKAKDFKAHVFPNRSGAFTWNELTRTSNPDAATIEATADLLGCTIDELFDREPASSETETNEAPVPCSTCDPRLLDIIEARDRQLDKAQEQADRLLSLLEKNGEELNQN